MGEHHEDRLMLLQKRFIEQFLAATRSPFNPQLVQKTQAAIRFMSSELARGVKSVRQTCIEVGWLMRWTFTAVRKMAVTHKEMRFCAYYESSTVYEILTHHRFG